MTTAAGTPGAYPGFWDWVTRNQYHYPSPLGTTDQHTYAQSNFISRVHQTLSNTNVSEAESLTATLSNLSYKDAWAVLDIDDTTVNSAVTGGFNYAVVNSRLAGGTAIQVATTHAAEKAAVDASTTLTYPDALSTLADQPPLACCKFEEWNKRTYMRAVETISRELMRKCKQTATYNWATGSYAYTPVGGMLTCIGDADRTTSALLT